MIKIILYKIKQFGKSKRTSLALNCKIPYDRFTKYLTVLINLELVILEHTVDGIFVNITDLGRRFLEKTLRQ